jgi:two-component system sensor histidine kinase GlrK
MAYAGEAAKKLNIIIWSIALCFMVGTAFVTIRGVTKPMLVLVTKTRDVAKGIFTSDLKIESPPEVASLARSFNAMCDRLNVAEKMKTSFLSVMSHELRTPLTSIKEGVGLLRDGAGGPTTERQNRLLEILSQETTRMIGLVSSLLDLTKMQQGMMPYYLTDESLSLLAESVITEMTPIAEARKIAIRTEFPHTLPMLRLDRERMLQALRNLMGNALKFTPEGGAVSISINRTDRGIQLSITDTGPGIPHESLDTIFEEYRQLPGRYPEGAQGSGLGLAIVKEIITAHGGRVWAESAPGPLNSAGSGTTLSFVLPL